MAAKKLRKISVYCVNQTDCRSRIYFHGRLLAYINCGQRVGGLGV